MFTIIVYGISPQYYDSLTYMIFTGICTDRYMTPAEVVDYVETIQYNIMLLLLPRESYKDDIIIK